MPLDASDVLRLTVARASDAPSVDRLRLDAYRSAPYFDVPDPKAILSSNDPKRSVILIVQDEARVVSTLRLSRVESARDAEDVLHGPAELSAGLYPALLLSRGATSRDARGQGLMGFLVSVGVLVAQRSAMQAVIGLQFDGTPHWPTMQRAGWKAAPFLSNLPCEVSAAPGDKRRLVYLSHTDYSTSTELSVAVHSKHYANMEVEQCIDTAVELIVGPRT